ncbi:MAG: TlpA family protein disulfide reductase [Acidobacteria bacterium]|nr:TlpA family protein disulfide reductase [Acidobacteriota bacterium]
MPGWQALYPEFKKHNLEIISVAEDTGGLHDAGKWIDAAKPEYTVLVDQEHVVSKLYNMVNVPTGVWINEQGRIVRPAEVALVDNRYRDLTGVDSTPYIAGLKDWADKGEQSASVMSEEKLRARLAPADPDVSLAAAEFGLGEQLYKSGHQPEAILHFKEAQRLNPRSWNYKRQAYALSSEKDYGTTFADEVKKAGGIKSYYPPPELPGSAAPEKKPY